MMGWGVTEQGRRKGPWTPEEDKLLIEYINLHGEGRWSSVARSAGLNRNGKSCRLRWVNYLRSGLKRGQITPLEEGIIIELHTLWGNKWSTIARYLPGRTDNEIKNYWRTHFKKKEKYTQKLEKRRDQLLKQKQKQQQQQNRDTMNRVSSQADTNNEKMSGEQEKQQQQQHGDTMNRVSSHADTNNEKMNGEQEMQQQQQQNMVFMQWNMENQSSFPVMYQDVHASWPLDQYMVDEGLWGGLWNLDDFHGHIDTSNCNKIASMQQNQATAFSFGGDSSNFYNEGYIF